MSFNEPKKIEYLEKQSLEIEAGAIQDSFTKIKVWNDIAWELRYSDIPRALNFSLKALKLLENHPYFEEQAKCYLNLTECNHRKGDYQKAIFFGKQAKALAEKKDLTYLEPYILSALGMAYWYIGELSDAMACFQSQLLLSQQLKDRINEAEALTNFGLIYGTVGDFNLSLKYSNQSLEIFQEIGHRHGQSMIINNIAYYHFHNGDYDLALANGLKALKLSKAIENQTSIMCVLDTVGVTYLELGNFDKALFYFKELLDLSSKVGATNYKGFALLGLGRLFFLLNDNEKALLYLKESLDLFSMCDQKVEMYRCHQMLYEIYEKKENIGNALEHFKKFHIIKEAILNENTDKKLKGLQISHEIEIHKREAEIHRLKNVELLEALGHIKEMTHKTMEANRSKSRFLANMSHEIRTPMNAILGLTQIILSSEISEEQRRYQKIVENSAEILLTLINNILDFSKMEAGYLEFEDIDFDLSSTLNAVYKMLETKAGEKGLTFFHDAVPVIPFSLKGDPVKLSQILSHIGINAIKFTEKGEVGVSLTLNKQTGETVMLHFTISDTGIGIKPSHQEVIFESFKQVDGTTSRKYGGTGLGLSISKQLVERMGGKIWVESDVGKGSRFHIILSFGISHKEKKDYALSDEKNAIGSMFTKNFKRSLKILLAEDNKFNQMLAVNILEKMGHETTIAKNGIEAIEMVQAESFDLILMDIQMPQMDGLEATTHIRQLKTAAKDIPIIAMTAYAMKENQEKCLALGMNDYVAKPIEPEILKKTLIKWESYSR